MILRHSFTPLHNSRLSHLCGPLDEHLRTIERSLEVRIAHRHEQFKVEGPKAAAHRAMEVLQALYEQAARPVPASLVQLMLAGDGTEPLPTEDAGLSTRRGDLRARTATQGVYLQNIADHDITFGIGPAGTGKTYLAMAKAVQALQAKQVTRIILTRPAIEAGERLGFLPGTLNDKIDPYLRPLYDALHDMLDSESLPKLLTGGVIEVAPLAYMRGRTLNDAFIVLDEAQNTSMEQMKMFLTRLGFGSKIVVTGDITQVDLPGGVRSGLRAVQGILDGVEDIAFCTLTNRDVVRHKLVGRIVAAYDRYDSTLAETVASPRKTRGSR